MAKSKPSKRIATHIHQDAKRLNIPTAEHQSVMTDAQKAPVPLRYPRNADLDPQLVWRGKDAQDATDLLVDAPPLYIQEKVHPKVLIDDLARDTADRAEAEDDQIDLFADFNGIPEGAERTEFYRHEQNWSNRMILGDSLKVMASLAEREGLRGKVQMIYLDPPYGIKFNSNFQWSTTSRDVKDGNASHITREPEQVKAFRDTWRDGIHSYLSYLRDRLTVARDLLTESGSIFVQIGDENVHRVRALMDEVFGEENLISFMTFKKTSGAGSPSGGTQVLASVCDYLLWFAKNRDLTKYRQPYREKYIGGDGGGQYTLFRTVTGAVRNATEGELSTVDPQWRSCICSQNPLTSQSSGQPQFFSVEHDGLLFSCGNSGWKTTQAGMKRLKAASRLWPIG